MAEAKAEVMEEIEDNHEDGEEEDPADVTPVGVLTFLTYCTPSKCLCIINLPVHSVLIESKSNALLMEKSSGRKERHICLVL